MNMGPTMHIYYQRLFIFFELLINIFWFEVKTMNRISEFFNSKLLSRQRRYRENLIFSCFHIEESIISMSGQATSDDAWALIIAGYTIWLAQFVLSYIFDLSSL